MYQNEPGERNGSILVTSKGLYLIEAEGVKYFPYEEMRTLDVTHHAPNFLLADPSLRTLSIGFSDGRTVLLSVRGIQGQTAMDLFSFYGYLGGVIQTLGIIREKASKK